MALAMARPQKDRKTGVWWLRQRLPRDLSRLRGTSVSLPRGEGFATIKIGDKIEMSLATKDAPAAKERHAVADAALKKFWDGQRRGPSRLTQKQTVALAGTLYAAFAASFEDDPGSPGRWTATMALNADAAQGRYGLTPLKIGLSHEEQRASSMEERFGKLVDAVIARNGLHIDAESRSRLIEQSAIALDDAACKLHRNAQGSYSPDPVASRLPAWEPPVAAQEEAPKADGRIVVSDLRDRWHKHHVDLKAANTVKRYMASLASFAAFSKDKDIRSLTEDDLHAWAEHRRDQDKVRPRVINKNDLVAASSVFK